MKEKEMHIHHYLTHIHKHIMDGDIEGGNILDDIGNAFNPKKNGVANAFDPQKNGVADAFDPQKMAFQLLLIKE